VVLGSAVSVQIAKSDFLSADQEYILTLSGVLNNGKPIEGKDCIVFVKKEKKED
jgi:hypothetical protein